MHSALPSVADPVRESAKFGLLDRYREESREGLRTNHVATVWQRLVQRTGLPVNLTAFPRYVGLVSADLIIARDVTVWRPEVHSGERVERRRLRLENLQVGGEHRASLLAGAETTPAEHLPVRVAKNASQRALS